jgi:hypothetical protein
MGTSQSSQLYEIINCVTFFNFRRVLDVGVGYGQYGFMLRHRVAGTMDLEAMTIDGIEGFAPYVTDLQRLLYNNLFLDRAEIVLPSLPDQAYECALLIDVLEHMDAPTAHVLMGHLRRVATVVLVSTPAEWIPQSDDRNPLENHVSLWNRSALAAMGATAFLPNDQSHLALFAAPQDEARVRAYARKRQRLAYVPLPLRRHLLKARSIVRRQ